MDIRWNAYSIIRLLHDGALRDLPRPQARENYRFLIENRAAREFELGHLLAHNGSQLEATERGIQQLNDFFRENVSEDPDRPRMILPEWISVSFDIGLFLGDFVISRHPHLRWGFEASPKSSIDFQQPVIVGFQNAGMKNYSWGFIRRVLGYANQIANEGNGPETVVVRGEEFTLREKEVDGSLFMRIVRGIDQHA